GFGGFAGGGGVPGGGFGGGFPGGGFGGMPGGGFGGFAGGFPRFPGLPGMFDNNRLGARIEQPSPVLLHQLDLPKDKGIVLNEVKADSAAAKAGIKSLDILLELGGKAVPSKLPEFIKVLNDIKKDEAVEAVVIRKGKREAIKGLKLPEAPKNAFPGFPGFDPKGFPGFDPNKLPGFDPKNLLPPGFDPKNFLPPGVDPNKLPGFDPKNFPLPAGFDPNKLFPGGLPGAPPGVAQQALTVTRSNGGFTARLQTGALGIS